MHKLPFFYIFAIYLAIFIYQNFGCRDKGRHTAKVYKKPAIRLHSVDFAYILKHLIAAHGTFR